MSDIVGLGVDIVVVSRFRYFHLKSRQSLRRLFSSDEIYYCCFCERLSAERFAVRFAAKEALYKALSSAVCKRPVSFLSFCSFCSIEANPIPRFVVDWQRLDLPIFDVLVSLSHTQESAIAAVIVRKFDNIKK